MSTPSDIIIDQLKGSSVNGFSFFPYTGIKIQKQDDNSVSLKAPGNPGNVSNITILYDYGQDLYNITIDGNTTKGKYAGDMVNFIIDEMGVR